jgi:uncharacterized damage-inducible protein DinB
MLAEAVVERCRALLARDVSRIQQATAALTDQQLWWRPNERSNSIANLILHLCGNLSQWGLAGLGGESFERRRRQEFDARETTTTRAELLARLDAVVSGVETIVGRMDESELMRPRVIQGYDVTGIRALIGIVEHLSHHTGQIIYVAKILSPPDHVIDFYPQHKNE